MLVLANETRFDRVQARLCILLVLFDEGFELVAVLVEQVVEQQDTGEVFVDALNDDVGQVFVLVGEQT